MIGGSGKGKTYSFRNMDRDKTVFINAERKPYPFPGRFRMETSPKTTAQMLEDLQRAGATASANCVVFDSFSAFLDKSMEECKAAYKGWDIMSAYNSNITRFNNIMKDIDKEVIVTGHYEYVGDEMTGLKEKRLKTKGKEWEGLVEKDYTIVVYTETTVLDPNKRPDHTFRLVTDGANSAKTPPDIFGPDVLWIPNDARVLFDKIQEFKNRKE
jgi:hypothetical protein